MTPKNMATDDPIQKGKVCLVTGAGSVSGSPDPELVGNGRACAIAYAGAGASVLAVDIDPAAAGDTQKMIQAAGGCCDIFQADVSRAEDCRQMAAYCLDRFGRIDVLHNNVGIVPSKPGGILEADPGDWDRVMQVNLTSLFHTSRAVVPQMLTQGNGCILTTSSVAAIRHASGRFFIYSVSKSAVNTLTKCLAVELAPKGIRVNCIMPGLLDTPTIYKELLPDFDGNEHRMRRERSQRVPLQRMGTAWDVARLALFLISDKADYITGQIIAVDGGLSAMAG
jgi:NAD(P)-dependent dehydrogenase (short-subunit alcohol dehydrogenase family)